MAVMSDAAIKALETKAQRRGFATYGEIGALFKDADDHLGEMDSLCMSLLELGVEIVAGPPTEEAPVVEAEPEQEEAQPKLGRSAPDDLHEVYMAEVRQFPLLTAEDEVDLGKAIRQGRKARLELRSQGLSSSKRLTMEARVQRGDRAWHRFVEANLRLVVHIAWQYRDQGMLLPDLIQEGNTGLLKAVDKWDYRRGCRFSTYAVWWIRQAISRAIDDSGLIRLPVYLQDDLHRVSRAAVDLGATSDGKATIARVAEAVGKSADRVRYLLEEVPTVRRLESLPCWAGHSRRRRGRRRMACLPECPMRKEAAERLPLVSPDDDCDLPPCLGGTFTGEPSGMAQCFDALVAATKDDAEEDEIVLASLRETLASLLEALPRRQRRILTLRYGLRDGCPRTLEEVGRAFGLTRERIRQLEAKALKTLAHPKRRAPLKGYLN